jgi:hypothetical protein
VTWPNRRGHDAILTVVDEVKQQLPDFLADGPEYPDQDLEQMKADARDVFHAMCDTKCGPTCGTLSRGEIELRGFWFDMAEKEATAIVPKALEYSATDLADIGHVLARTAGRTVSDEEAAELGVFFYLQGKLSRWAGAVAQGQRPSDDTIYDIGVYCRMAQRIRQAGSWPGLEEEL